MKTATDTADILLMGQYLAAENDVNGRMIDEDEHATNMQLRRKIASQLARSENSQVVAIGAALIRCGNSASVRIKIHNFMEQ